MTVPFDKRDDIVEACSYLLQSNGVAKKGQAFVMQALGRLDEREPNSVYCSMMNVDERVNNKPPGSTPREFSIDIGEREQKIHISVEAESYALCGVHIIMLKPETELTPQQSC